MTGHSQYGEDLRAAMILKERGCTSGRVLEIGAWNPIDKSNSRLFIEAGWNAVLIEPSPKAVSDLAREYKGNPNVHVIASPLTPGGGTIKLQLSDDALSGGQIQEQWRELGGYYGSAWFNSLSMADLVNQFGGDFDLVSIDTEGTSFELLSSFLDTGARPLVIIVEHDGRHVELAQVAGQANYRMVEGFPNGTNAMFEWTGRR